MPQAMPIKDLDSVEPELLLQPTPFIQSDALEVIEFARKAVGDATTDLERGVRLFYAVRDGIHYDPYHLPGDAAGYAAATVVREGHAFCIPKAILLAAVARHMGIPAALAFCDVRNHLVTDRLRELMDGKELFIYHGYTMLKLDRRWFKLTSAFNLSLCEKFQVLPLDFDGTEDALLHPFDANNNKHMEYVNERGVFADFPFEEISTAFREYYPKWGNPGVASGRFEEEKPLIT